MLKTSLTKHLSREVLRIAVLGASPDAIRF